MKKGDTIIYSNKFFTMLILLLQIAVLVAGYVWLSDYALYITGATTLVSACLIFYEVNRVEGSNYKTAWIILVAIVPVFGALLYLYLHMDWSTKELRHKQKMAAELIKEEQDRNITEEIYKKDKTAGGLCNFLANYGGAAVYKNTDTEYFPLGDDFLEDMLEKMKGAKKFIFLEYFIINQNKYVWSEMLAVLRERVNAGVEVRVMYDGMGCMVTLPRRYDEQLSKYGIKARIFSPIQPLLSTYQNNRDHRKITVIDGEYAYCGGVNLADEYANREERFGHWKDTGMRMSGDAVRGLTKLFLEMWNGIALTDTKEDCAKYLDCVKSVNKRGYIAPLGDSPLDNVQTGRQVYIDLLNTAEKYVHIMTPYLVIDDGMYEAMRYAVQRGVDVKIIMPHIPDKKYMFMIAHTYYPQLLRAGVRIFEYVPGFVHAKTTVSDDNKAIVGTINYDYRSLFLHYECGVFMYEADCVADVERDYAQTLDSCMEITEEYYRKELGFFHKLFGRAARLVAPLL